MDFINSKSMEINTYKIKPRIVAESLVLGLEINQPPPVWPGKIETSTPSAAIQILVKTSHASNTLSFKKYRIREKRATGLMNKRL
jgi:hypothetical protein